MGSLSRVCTPEEVDMMMDVINDISIALSDKLATTPMDVSALEKAIFDRCARVMSEVKAGYQRRNPLIDTIWRFDNESFCVNALFKDRTVQMAGQAYRSPYVAELAAKDMVKGLEYCPLNRRNITHFLICSRRERELFRIANEKDK